MTLIFFLLSVSCAGPKPTKEFALAEIALSYAQKIGAENYARGWFYKAETVLQQAQSAYNKNENRVAKKLFIRARKYAERAENSSRVQKFKAGESPID